MKEALEDCGDKFDPKSWWNYVVCKFWPGGEVAIDTTTQRNNRIVCSIVTQKE